jgi:hypothetical protein
MKSGRLGLILAAALAWGSWGCAGPGNNVRAIRAYAHEDASLKVSIDRIEDLGRTLELVDRILSDTSYTPGDFWTRRLPLSNSQAVEIKDYLKTRYPYNQGEYEVPILKVYRVHIENVMSEYAPPPEKGMYPSLLDAVAALSPRGQAIRNNWTLYKDATAQLGDAAEAEERIKDEIAAIKSEDGRRARDPEFAAARLKVAEARKKVEDSQAMLSRDAQNLAADAKLDTAQKQQIARDAVAVLSVVLRVEMEALALIPVVAIQTVRAIPTAPKDMLNKPHLKILKQVWQLPMYLGGLSERFRRQIAALEVMTTVMAKATQQSLGDTPGFALSESIVDQIVGITLDSFRVDLKAGGEAFIFSSIGTADRSSSDDGKVKYDYRGRRYKLDYRIEPIVLANGRLDITLDWIRMPGVANLGFGYSTDRVYRSGGSIESNSLVKQLGIDGPASDVLDAALGVLGVKSSVRIASWTAGELRQVEATNVSNAVAVAPLQLKQTQIDLGYDVAFLIEDARTKAILEELVLGGRYLEYTLPRIVYELPNVSTDPSIKDYQFFPFGRETPPQPVRSRYFMAGFTARLGQGEAPRFSPFLDIGFYGGGGPTKFYFLQDPSRPDDETNRDEVREAAFAFSGQGALGLRWRLLPRGSRLRLDLRALYGANVIYTKIARTGLVGGREVTTDFGALDVFHGPAIAIRGAL